MATNNKYQAAIAGVMAYLKAEEEQHPVEPDVIIGSPNAWALNGRQNIMQMRSLMQRRVLKR